MSKCGGKVGCLNVLDQGISKCGRAGPNNNIQIADFNMLEVYSYNNTERFEVSNIYSN